MKSFSGNYNNVNQRIGVITHKFIYLLESRVSSRATTHRASSFTLLASCGSTHKEMVLSHNGRDSTVEHMVHRRAPIPFF